MIPADTSTEPTKPTPIDPEALTADIVALAADSRDLPEEIVALLHLASGCIAGISMCPRTTTGRWQVVERADRAEAHMVEFEAVCAAAGDLGLALEAARIARECAKIARQHLDLTEVARQARAILSESPGAYSVVGGVR